MELLSERYHKEEITKAVYDDAQNQIEQQLQSEDVFQDVKELARHVKADARRQFVIPYGHELFLQYKVYTLSWNYVHACCPVFFQ